MNISKTLQLNLWPKDRFRICIACKTPLPLEQFYEKRSRPNGRFSKCKACELERGRDKYRNNPVKEAERKAKANQLDKQRAFAAYGGSRCVCCGEKELVFLSLDHINGGGSRWRRQKLSLYRWVRQQHYPPGFQVLCFNCNWAKSHGGCPHVPMPRNVTGV